MRLPLQEKCWVTGYRLPVWVTALVGLGLASVASAAAAQGSAGRVVIKRSLSDSGGRDTVNVMSITVAPEEILRMIGELMASRQVEERVVASLRSASRADAERLRELNLQLSSIARRNAGLASAIRLQCSKDMDQPAGYLGVNFEGIEMRKSGAGPMLYFLGDRPTIVSVEPGSPAERAGLSAHDEVVAIAGNDARRPFALGEILKPGARVAVRVNRDGQVREHTVVVAKRPDDYGSPCTGLDEVISFERTAPQAAWARQRAEAVAREPERRVVVGQAPPGGSFGYSFVTPFPTSGANMVGGASFLAIDQEWRETLGADRGLLVLSVLPGTPAQSAGLRKGDVVLSSGDDVIGTATVLRRLVANAGAAGVTLKVMRGRDPKPVTVTLKASER